MKRLTKKSPSGISILNIENIGDVCMHYTKCNEGDCDDCSLNRLINRLYKYEETGLKPKQIKRLKKVCLYNPYSKMEKI